MITSAKHYSPGRHSGFTLIEVLVALVIVSLGMMAVQTQLNRYALTAGFMEDKTLASWIGTNKVVEFSTAQTWPEIGTTDDEVEFAGRLWQIEIEVSETQVDNLRRVDVDVSHAESPETIVQRVSGLIEPPVPQGFVPVRWLSVAQGGPPVSPRRHIAAFTLIELLVAMAIVAIIGAMAFGGINLVMNQHEIAREHTERWRDIQLAMRLVVQDLAQLHPRPMREEFGEGHLPALLSTASSQFALEFSRGGWPNPAGFPRGTVARVAYDWEDDVLVRYHWPVMDRTPDVVPARTELLDGVISVETQFLDRGGSWQTQWPTLEAGGGGGRQQNVNRPRAVRFIIELEDFGRVWRDVETSG